MLDLEKLKLTEADHWNIAATYGTDEWMQAATATAKAQHAQDMRGIIAWLKDVEENHDCRDHDFYCGHELDHGTDLSWFREKVEEAMESAGIEV